MQRVIIIDDESIGINTLKILIEKYVPAVRVVATSTEPETGIKLIEDYRPDIVFLDISMPKMSGFELINRLNYKDFKLVFTTAHEEYAIKAIKIKAYDYLLKPIDIDELKQCVTNILKESVQTPAKLPILRTIELSVKDGIIFIKPDDIIRLEASGSYTTFYLINGKKYIASKNLKDYEALLDPTGFYRCHLSHVINLQHVIKLISTGGIFAQMSDNSLVEISKKTSKYLSINSKIPDRLLCFGLPDYNAPQTETYIPQTKTYILQINSTLVDFLHYLRNNNQTKMKKVFLSILSVFSLILNINAQIITTIAGNGATSYIGDGGQATAAGINRTVCLAFDAAGNLYVTDQYNGCIRKISTSGIMTTVAGGGSAGLGDGGPATSAMLSAPIGIVFDASGNLYIADQYNYRIRKVNTSGIITTVAGNGSTYFSGDNGPATSAGLFNPSSVAFDAAGNMYIADYSHNRIRKVDASGIITTVVGNGTASYTGDGGQATNAELNCPSTIIFDPSGNLIIADRLNHRIRKVSTSGIISTVAGNGTASYTGDGGQATLAGLNGPFGINLDGSGNLYIGDYANNVMRKVSTSGIITTIAGTGVAGFSGDGGSATAAKLSEPNIGVFDSGGNLYVSDASNNRVRKITNVYIPTGVESFLNKNNNDVVIYPNPTNGVFSIKTSLAFSQIELFNLTGRSVLKKAIDECADIDVGCLPIGVYNLQISTIQGVLNRRIVISK